MTNPLSNWQVDPATITMTGRDLMRPECILWDDSGDLWIADLRGIMRIAPDGSQTLLAYTPPLGTQLPDIGGNAGLSLPNGLCFDRNGAFYVANFGTNVIEHVTRDGTRSLVLDAIDGVPLGKANFPALDRSGRLWFSVTASAEGWAAGRRGSPDGYIAVLDASGARIVVDGLTGTNEIRFDPEEAWLYVAETGADRISRFRVGPGGTLCAREIYGPERLGGGPDGFAFDSAGNLWTTLIVTDQLVAITPDGEKLLLWEDGNRAEKARSAAAGMSLRLGSMPGDGKSPRMASITFGGPDLRTVYIGSLCGTSLPTFRAPIAGRRIPR